MFSVGTNRLDLHKRSGHIEAGYKEHLLCRQRLVIDKKLKESVSIVRLMYNM